MQVKAEKWASPGGRISLVGDAGYCATPVSGMGTTLSLTGAYILAGEIASSPDDPKLAAERYQEKMKPLVKKAQGLPPGVPGIVYPVTEWGITFTYSILRTAAFLYNSGMFSWIGWIVGLLGSSKEAIELPDYSHLLVEI